MLWKKEMSKRLQLIIKRKSNINKKIRNSYETMINIIEQRTIGKKSKCQEKNIIQQRENKIDKE